MQHFREKRRFGLLQAALFWAALLCRAEPTPLDRYVAEPDSAYSFREIRTSQYRGGRFSVLELTSQRFRSPEEVNPCLWKHHLTVCVPREVRYGKGLLIIGGGANSSPPPSRPSAPAAMISQRTHSVVAELRQVPNQPLVFSGDGKKRYEDKILAYTWRRYLETGDSGWPGQLPMAKSAVKALDAIQAFLPDRFPSVPPVSSFVVTGASKRGWTTYLLGAVDKRVCGIIPVVIDVVHIEPSMRHHYAAYGFWAPAIGDYVAEGVTEQLGTDAARKLFSFVDPYSYRARYTMPKYIVNSTGDQFFLPDSWQFYFHDLPGESHLRYVPNTDHSLRGSRMWEELCAFYLQILTGKPRPRVLWRLSEDGAWVVRPSDRPRRVLLWYAANPKTRDFRLMTIGKAWKAEALQPSEDGTYRGKAPVPAEGWCAYFVEAAYEVGGLPFSVTTGVKVLPDRLPFASKTPAGAAGRRGR